MSAAKRRAASPGGSGEASGRLDMGFFAINGFFDIEGDR
jgi:hypothetical protein